MSKERKLQIAFTEEEIKSINAHFQGLEDILKSKMIQLTPEESRKYGRLGKQTIGWAKEIHDDTLNNPFLVPEFVDAEEWARFTALVNLLTPFTVKLKNLAQQLEDTNRRIGFEVVDACNEVYDFARYYSKKDKPGFKIIYEKWSLRYKKRTKKNTENLAQTS
jgi:hypothetical protein